jgi:hypothetical protein
MIKANSISISLGKMLFACLCIALAVVMVSLMATYLPAQETAEPVTLPTDIFGLAGGLAMIIPFVIGALKKYANLSTSICPVVAFALGVVGGVAVHFLHLAPGLSLWQTVAAGIAVGGTSTGLYDIKKQLTQLFI